MAASHDILSSVVDLDVSSIKRFHALATSHEIRDFDLTEQDMCKCIFTALQTLYVTNKDKVGSSNLIHLLWDSWNSVIRLPDFNAFAATRATLNAHFINTGKTSLR